MKSYLTARKLSSESNISLNDNNNKSQRIELNTVYQELFMNSARFPLNQIKSDNESAKYIKLFEPSVIYCLTVNSNIFILKKKFRN